MGIFGVLEKSMLNQYTKKAIFCQGLCVLDSIDTDVHPPAVTKTSAKSLYMGYHIHNLEKNKFFWRKTCIKDK